MKRLRPKVRVDQLRSEARPKTANRIGRYVYLTLLALLVIYLLDIATEGILYLEGDGMVVRDTRVLATERVATVIGLRVDLGAEVVPGQDLARLRSQDALETLARLTADLTEAEFSLTEMRMRREILQGLLEEARVRVAWNEDARRELGRAQEEGLLVRQKGAQMVDDTYRSIADLRHLEAEARTIESELPRLEHRVAAARDVVEALTAAYDDGRMTAPVAGTIGALYVEHGSVVKVGDPVMRILSGPAFVLAYMPTGALHRVREGERVTLRDGVWVANGRVDRILPVATVLPDEFKRAFEATRTQQVVRIALAGDAEPPPTFTTVAITWSHSPLGLVARLIGRFREPWALEATGGVGSSSASGLRPEAMTASPRGAYGAEAPWSE